MNLMKMMKQAQELQGRMQQMQEQLASLQIEGQSGGGLVKVTLNGKRRSRTPRARWKPPCRPKCRRSPAASPCHPTSSCSSQVSGVRSQMPGFQGRGIQVQIRLEGGGPRDLESET
jgi:hypothetical protein